jgi:hypothetical protein
MRAAKWRKPASSIFAAEDELNKFGMVLRVRLECHAIKRLPQNDLHSTPSAIQETVFQAGREIQS